MFFEHCIVVFLDRTKPASSIQNPAAIHITRKPCIKKDSVLNINAVSADTSAEAEALIATVDTPAVKQKSV